MTDAGRPLWEKEESVEAKASPAFAFRYWASVENMTRDPGIERVETEGPSLDRPGMRGRTHLAGGGTTDWVVAEVDPDRRLVIEVALPESSLRFELRFDERVGGGSVLTQRVSLFGPNAAAHLEGVEAGFGTSLRDGMRAVRDRIDAAAARARMIRLLERRFKVKVPLERAWSHLEKVERWPTWARHIRGIDLEPAGPLGPESAGALVLTNGIRSTFRMEELNPGVNWKWKGTFLWITVHYDHRFARLGPEETEILFALDGDGFGVGLFGRMFAALYARNLDRAIPNLILEIERDQ